MRKVCFVSSTHVSYNPRLVKEADALAAGGYDVRVVAVNVEKWRARLDEELLKTKRWSLLRIEGNREHAEGRLRWLWTVLRQKIHGALGSDENAYSRYCPELFRAAVKEPADLFIAHNLPALPAAVQAAQLHGAKIGFDAEDFHRGEFPETTDTAAIRRLTARIEAKYIPRCDYVTAASDGIAEAYARELGIAKPVTILNVFPKMDRFGRTPEAELARERHGNGLSLYWYSQVIGSDRGLMDALEATSLLRPRVRLHVRGAWASTELRHQFERELGALNIRDLVHVMDPVPPDQLIERAAEHDVGLALETGETANRRIALTNKLFTYMLAGIAVAATDVEGQAGILKDAPGAGFLYPSGSPQILANHLKEWLDDPSALEKVRQHSLFLGETRYCWEIESTKFLEVIRRVLPSIPGH